MIERLRQGKGKTPTNKQTKAGTATKYVGLLQFVFWLHLQREKVVATTETRIAPFMARIFSPSALMAQTFLRSRMKVAVETREKALASNHNRIRIRK